MRIRAYFEKIKNFPYLFLPLFACLVLFTALTAHAQNNTKQITGKVVDQESNPLAGVTVTVKSNTVRGTITDQRGDFTLSAPTTDVLVFSYMGYLPLEVAVSQFTEAGRTVVLQLDTQQLGDVVVIGYGSVKKENLTGAVAQITSKELENRSVSTITQAMQGKVAGVNITSVHGQPGYNQSINIRGFTGISTEGGVRANVSAGPLVVIDGVQGGDINVLETNDVESISFLKDAASAAIYGSSAPYGVLLVTTKKGAKGKPVISYNNNFGWAAPINLPTFMSSLDYANAWNEAAANAGGSPFFSEATIARIRQYLSGELKDGTQPTPDGKEWATYSEANANTNWFDVLFKKASFSQQHNMNVSGAGDNYNYYASLGYMSEQGMYKYGDELNQRFNARLNLSADVTKWLTFSMRGAFARTALDVPIAADSWNFTHLIGRNYPTNPIYNPDGGYSQPSYIQSLTEGGRRDQAADNAVLTGELVVRPLPGWNITANYTYNGNYINVAEHGKNYDILKPGGVSAPAAAFSSMSRRMNKNQIHTVNAFTSYEKAFTGGHNFKVMVGYMQELIDNLELRGSATYLYTDQVPMISMSYGDKDAGDNASQLASRGVFSRINYNYKEKYLIEFNGRYDGSSRFMRNVRSDFYPGVSGAWVVSKEPFWKPVLNYVNQFKIRASYASLGDQGFTSNYYPFYPSLTVNSPTSAGAQYVFSDGTKSNVKAPGLVNPGLKWITVNTVGVGVDLSMLRNRLELSFDWYNRFAKDFVDAGSAVPSWLGTAVPPRNAARTSTKGWELSASWRDRVGEFSYGARFVLSDYKGKVLEYPNEAKLISDLWYDGMTMGEIWGFETVGLFKDQAEIDGIDQSAIWGGEWRTGDVHYKDIDGDDKITRGNNTVDDSGDMKVIGNNTPRYAFGLTLDAAWKGFDLTMFLQGVGKRDYMFDTSANYFWGFVAGEYNSSYFTEHADRWTESNPNGYFPRIYYDGGNADKNHQAQTRYLQNAAYMRIKNLQLGYTIPKSITEKIKLQRVRVFFNVENLATITNLIKVVDPEIVSPDAKTYPLKRTWAFGVNLTF